MHFTYNDTAPEADVLSQGDVLRRTPELEQVLKQYYPYFGDNEENQFFLVITQACDLVPRSSNVCKAKYIELAAVRPLRIAVEREFASHIHPEFDLPFAVASQKARPKFEQFLERLFNNNEQDYFFLRAEVTAGLPEDCCAFLHLTVPIKAEHYKTCLKARVLTLNTIFQAKLGWLVGQIYARVGTTDWTRKELIAMVQHIARGSGAWIDDKLLKQTLEVVRQWKAANPDGELTEAQLKQMVGKLPTKKSLAIEHLEKLLMKSSVVSKLTTAGNMTNEDLKRLINNIRSDQQFTSFFN